MTLYQETVALLDRIFVKLMDDIDFKNKETWMKGIEEIREFDSACTRIMNTIKNKPHLFD